MMRKVQCSCLLLLCLTAIDHCHGVTQSCIERHQVVGVLRQMEKFLKGQEMRFTEGLRAMKSKLAALQNSVSRFPQADQHADANRCASNPCQNGGTCVEGINQYKCTCPQNWSGSHCQHQTQTAPPEWSVMNDPAFSRKPRCAKVDRAQHCSCDAGFHMSGTSDSSICQDVNECEVYKVERGGKLCAHACVNIPGSYRCSCPAGYRLLPDGRSCEDVDECLSQQHNCTRGTTCINTGGGFQCVSPECPHSHGNVSYVRTSPFQCERNPCPMESRSCHLAPKTVSFHYLSLPSQLQTPATLFRMATAALPGRSGPDSLRFGIGGAASAKGLFIMQRSDRQTGELILVQSLRGPQDIAVEVDMSEYAERVFQAKHVARVHIMVSPYEF
ncbi:fibulin-7 isoform X3 [Brienomyrus brachyistius]|uniref:fibulin-7 isoform X3 n=1 Tax=Brienomyrus brachyistius TaxID=42636 RepID=UPI0020B3BEC0|nr:fibulin-7 isoform X3 [Brienomyrus brachyistius]